MHKSGEKILDFSKVFFYLQSVKQGAIISTKNYGKLGEKMFPCDRCGCCCRNILLSHIFIYLDRGDGVCKHFDNAKNLCKIYDNRPAECNVDLMYEKHYADKMTREKFYELNIAACKELKKMVKEG